MTTVVVSVFDIEASAGPAGIINVVCGGLLAVGVVGWVVSAARSRRAQCRPFPSSGFDRDDELARLVCVVARRVEDGRVRADLGERLLRWAGGEERSGDQLAALGRWLIVDVDRRDCPAQLQAVVEGGAVIDMPSLDDAVASDRIGAARVPPRQLAADR